VSAGPWRRSGATRALPKRAADGSRVAVRLFHLNTIVYHLRQQVWSTQEARNQGIHYLQILYIAFSCLNCFGVAEELYNYTNVV
jgi:hypothetical protein